MQGYLRVSPAGAQVPLVAKISDKALMQAGRLEQTTRPGHEAHGGSR